jgi:hypothetical protein
MNTLTRLRECSVVHKQELEAIGSVALVLRNWTPATHLEDVQVENRTRFLSETNTAPFNNKWHNGMKERTWFNDVTSTVYHKDEPWRGLVAAFCTSCLKVLRKTMLKLTWTIHLSSGNRTRGLMFWTRPSVWDYVEHNEMRWFWNEKSWNVSRHWTPWANYENLNQTETRSGLP